MRRKWSVPLIIAAGLLLVVALVAVAVVAVDRWRGGPPSAGPTVPAAGPTATAGGSPSASPRPGTAVPTGPAATTPAPPRPTTAAPAPAFPPALAGQDITRIPTTRRVVALTFDAGANADGLPSILATLAREGVPATFFLTGAFVTGHPNAVASIRAAGYRVGNHSATHPYFTSLSDAGVRAEVTGAESTIRLAGLDPRPLFRFPFGDRDTRTIRDVNSVGYVGVRWTVDTLGWQGLSSMTASGVVQRALGSLQPGEIVLMHVGSHPTDHSTLDADALPTMISQIRARGYGFVSLDALLG